MSINEPGENEEKLDKKAEYEKARAEKIMQKEASKKEKEEKVALAKAQKAENKDKNQGEKRKGRNSAEPRSIGISSAALENRREIPTTTYDLLNSRFGDSNKARYVLISLYILGLVILGIVLVIGLTTKISIGSVNKSIDLLSTDKAKLFAQFGTSTGLKGVSETDLIDRAKAFGDATKAAVGKQADAGTIVNEIKGKDIPGITVNSIDITRGDLKISATDPKNKDPKAVAALASSYVLTVVGTGKDFASIVSWSDSIRSIPILYNVAFERSGLKITLTASIKNSTPPGATTLLSSFGITSDNNAGAVPAQGSNPTVAGNTNAAQPAPSPSTSGATK